MNRYILKIKFLGENFNMMVETDESIDYLKEVIEECQEDFNFDSPCDLMDYVCETYNMEWSDVIPDLVYDMEWK